jgi:hypothetical protein
MIEELITALVREAPALDAHVIEELRGELAANGAPLALAIARVLELVGEGLVEQAVALPALAEACATLVHERDPRALEAARYQIDTLEPTPSPPRPPVVDVTVDALASRGPRRRT